LKTWLTRQLRPGRHRSEVTVERLVSQTMTLYAILRLCGLRLDSVMQSDRDASALFLESRNGCLGNRSSIVAKERVMC
jgi:hypothetical protein